MAGIYFAKKLKDCCGTASSQLALSGKPPVLHQKSRNNPIRPGLFSNEYFALQP